MFTYIRYSKGSGQPVLYARVRDKLGQFWDFVGKAWSDTETDDCKVFFTEHADSDDYESLYTVELIMPTTGGVVAIEAVETSTGNVVGLDVSDVGTTYPMRILTPMPEDVAVQTIWGYVLNADKTPAPNMPIEITPLSKTASSVILANMHLNYFTDENGYFVFTLMKGVQYMVRIGPMQYKINVNDEDVKEFYSYIKT